MSACRGEADVIRALVTSGHEPIADTDVLVGQKDFRPNAWFALLLDDLVSALQQ